MARKARKARHANDGTRKARKINTIKHQYNKQEQYIKNNKIFFWGGRDADETNGGAESARAHGRDDAAQIYGGV